MTHPTRNIILVAGPSASGKTHALNTIRHEIREFRLAHEFIPISDSHTILDRVREDDARGSQNHYHPWEGGGIGHNHDSHPEITPLTLAGYEIGVAFMQDFFDALSYVPDDGVIHYAEWSGGKNINPPDDPASRADISFTTISRLLREGTITSTGLDRVLAVLHMEATREHRILLNESRGNPSDNMIRQGRASWKLDATAMRIFGEDDFLAAIPVLQGHGIPLIRTIHNKGRDEVQQELHAVLPEILSLWQGGETGLGGLRKKEY